MDNLKKFYKLGQVAKELGNIPTEDILRLALDGYLTLSVKLIKSPIWELGERVENYDPLWHPDSWTTIGPDFYRFGYLRPETKTHNDPLDLIIDSGNVRANLERYCYEIGANPVHIGCLLEGAILQRGANDFSPINPETGLSNFTRPNSAVNGKFVYQFSIPEDGYLVITKANLDAFKAKQTKPQRAIKQGSKTSWQEHARELAKDLYQANKNANNDSTLEQYASRVSELLLTDGFENALSRDKKYSIGTIKKEALQGDKWYRIREKIRQEDCGEVGKK